MSLCDCRDVVCRCRELFKRFDMDGSGTIQMWELKEALNALGQWPSDEVLPAITSNIP